MDTQDLNPQIEDLASNIDDLEESLAPVLRTALSASTGKLPLLDKAKLYVLATYAIESVLFSTLKLHGVDAKTHPIFNELSRVKEYFGKIKSAETAGSKPTAKLDRDAASRFVRAGLAGNEKYDRERAGRRERERAGAKRKLEDMAVGTHTRFDGAAKRIRASEETARLQGDSNHLSGGHESAEGKQDKKAAKRQRRLEAKLAKQSPTESPMDHVQNSQEVAPSVKESGEPPKSNHEASEVLLEESLPAANERKGKKRRKGRAQAQQALEDRRAEEML